MQTTLYLAPSWGDYVDVHYGSMWDACEGAVRDLLTPENCDICGVASPTHVFVGGAWWMRDLRMPGGLDDPTGFCCCACAVEMEGPCGCDCHPDDRPVYPAEGARAHASLAFL